MIVLVAICAACGGTAADTSVNATHQQRRVDPALVRARTAATQAEMNLSWVRSAIASRWLLRPEGQEVFADFTGQVALDAVCHSLEKAMPAVDRHRISHLKKHEGLARAAPHRVRNGSTSALVGAGHRWAAHRLANRPPADLAEWCAWAHDLHQAVRRTIRNLAHDGSHPAPLRSLVHGSSWVASRAFTEYTRLCIRPAR